MHSRYRGVRCRSKQHGVWALLLKQFWYAPERQWNIVCQRSVCKSMGQMPAPHYSAREIFAGKSMYSKKIQTQYGSSIEKWVDNLLNERNICKICGPKHAIHLFRNFSEILIFKSNSWKKAYKKCQTRRSSLVGFN